jgi:hypothetical protein
MIHELDLKQPGLKNLLRSKGIGDNALIASMLMGPCRDLSRTTETGYAASVGPGVDLDLRFRRIAFGTSESLGHWCRQFRFRHAHMCIGGPVNSWPAVVHVTIGWTLWLRHLGQVISRWVDATHNKKRNTGWK